MLTSESLLVVGLSEYVRIVASRSSERLASDGRENTVHSWEIAQSLVGSSLEHDYERSCEKSGLGFVAVLA